MANYENSKQIKPNGVICGFFELLASLPFCTHTKNWDFDFWLPLGYSQRCDSNVMPKQTFLLLFSRKESLPFNWLYRCYGHFKDGVNHGRTAHDNDLPNGGVCYSAVGKKQDSSASICWNMLADGPSTHSVSPHGIYLIFLNRSLKEVVGWKPNLN